MQKQKETGQKSTSVTEVAKEDLKIMKQIQDATAENQSRHTDNRETNLSQNDTFHNDGSHFNNTIESEMQENLTIKNIRIDETRSNKEPSHETSIMQGMKVAEPATANQSPP